MSHGIPDGVYELKIGDSFASGSKSSKGGEYNTLRFDFKPASISSGNDAFIATTNQSEEVQVIVPVENQKPTIFRGSQKLIKGEKECLLIFDNQTNELRLEKMHANINVKKTRDIELDNHIKEEIKKMRKQRLPPQPPKEVKKERTFSTSSSMNGDDNDDGDFDEEASALEQMIAMPVKPQSSIKSENLSQKQQSPPRAEKPIAQKQSSSAKKVHSSSTKSHKGPQKSILQEDLQLSESSEGDDW